MIEHGFGENVLEASLNHFEFKLKEANYGRYPKGLMYGLSAMNSWLYDDEKPFTYLKFNKEFAFLKEQIGTDYYTNLLKQYVLHNPHKTIVTAVPKKGMNKDMEQKVAEKLAAYKAGLSEEEINALVKQTKELNDYQSEPSAEEDLMKIPLLELSDIGTEAFHVKNRESVIGEIPFISHDIFTNGIDYLEYCFSLNHVPVELLPYVSLLTSLYKEVDTDYHSYGSLANEIDLKTGGIGCSLGTMGVRKELGDYKISLSIRTKVLHENLEDALRLMEEILYTSHVTDRKRLKEVIAELVSQLKMSIPEGGHVSMANRVMSYFSKSAYLKELVEGISFYEFVSDLNRNFDDKYDEICKKLQAAIHAFAKPDNLMISYTGKEDITKPVERALESLQQYMNHDQSDVVTQELDITEKNEGFQTASKVQYVATAGNFAEKGYAYTGALQVLQVIFSYEYLWVRVRVKGGAYGCMCNFNRLGDSYFTSYRDPNLSKTYAVYKEAAEYVANFEALDRDMFKYIIGAISKLDTPMTPSAEGAYSFLCYLSGVTDAQLQKDRDEVLATNVARIRELAPYIETVLSKNNIAALGDEDVIQKEQKMFAKVRSL